MTNKEPLIVSDKQLFRQASYKSEKELENLAIKYVKNMFGEDAIYFDIKKKISSSKGIAGIPDGFIIDFKNNRYYIVEIELSNHDIIRHISNQLIRFKVAMGNKVMHEQISKEIHDKLKQMRTRQNIRLGDIQEIIGRGFGIIIIIDEVSEQLTEVVDVLSKDGVEVISVPFETYIDSANNHLYRFTTFTKDALEKESKKWTFKWTDTPVEKHFGKTNFNLRNVFSLLSKKICSLPDVKQKSRKGWVTYQTSPLKNFCTIKILPDCLEIHIKSNNSFKDDNGITKKIQRTPSWTFDRVFKIKSEKEIDSAITLIRQAYKCTCGVNHGT